MQYGLNSPRPFVGAPVSPGTKELEGVKACQTVYKDRCFCGLQDRPSSCTYDIDPIPNDMRMLLTALLACAVATAALRTEREAPPEGGGKVGLYEIHGGPPPGQHEMTAESSSPARLAVLRSEGA